MEQEKIQNLVLDTGSDEKLVRIILEFTDGDIEKAKKIIFAIPKDIFILFAKFSVVQHSSHGLVVYIYNSKLNIIERISALVSSDKEVLNFTINDDVSRALKNLDEQIARSSSFSGEMKKIESAFSKNDVSSSINQVFSVRDYVDEKKLMELVNRVFHEIYPDLDFRPELNIIRVDSFQLNKGEKELTETEQKVIPTPGVENDYEGNEYKNDSVIILNSQPYISPMKGVAIPKLKIGDRIYVDVGDTREVAVYLKKLLLEEAKKETGDDESRIKAVIEEMEYAVDTENVSIIVKFGPGIYGRIIISRDMKIDAVGRSSVNEPKQVSYNWLGWVFIVAFILLILFMTVFKK